MTFSDFFKVTCLLRRLWLQSLYCFILDFSYQFELHVVVHIKFYTVRELSALSSGIWTQLGCQITGCWEFYCCFLQYLTLCSVKRVIYSIHVTLCSQSIMDTGASHSTRASMTSFQGYTFTGEAAEREITVAAEISQPKWWRHPSTQQSPLLGSDDVRESPGNPLGNTFASEPRLCKLWRHR